MTIHCFLIYQLCFPFRIFNEMWSYAVCFLATLCFISSCYAQDERLKFAPRNSLGVQQSNKLNASPVQANALPQAYPNAAQPGLQKKLEGLRDSAANAAGQLRQNLPDVNSHMQNLADKIPSKLNSVLGMSRPKPSLLQSAECVDDIQAICTEEKRRNNFDILLCLQDKRVSVGKNVTVLFSDNLRYARFIAHYFTCF